VTAAIVDVKFEISFQSYSPSNAELGLQNAIGGWVIFLWARDLLTFGGALLNYT